MKNQPRHAEINGAARTRRDQNHVRLDRVEHFKRHTRPVGHHFRTRLPRVIGEGLDKAIVVIDQQQLHPNGFVFSSGIRGGGNRGPQQAEKPGGFEPGFRFFRRRIGIIEKRRASRISRVAIAQIGGADQNAGIDIATERKHANGTAIPAARRFFQILNGNRSRFLGCADQGDCPHVAEEGVKRIEAGG